MNLNYVKNFRQIVNYEHCAASRTVPGSIPSGVTGDFFHGSTRQSHVPWGRLSLWKWVPRISPGVKAAGAYGWRPTTLVVPNVKKIRGLNLPGTPWATSACCGMTYTFTFSQLRKIMKIRSVGAELFNADGQTDRRTDIHDVANRRFLELCESA